MNYDYTNYNLYRCQMYIFSWRYSPVSFFNILNLARDSFLKYLCCYFLLFLGHYQLFCCVCVCMYLAQSWEQDYHKIHHIAQKNIKTFHMDFFGVDIVNYFLTLRKLITCKKFQFLLFQSATCPHQMSDVYFFYSVLRLLFINNQMKSEEI